jgi:hypothetical protein
MWCKSEVRIPSYFLDLSPSGMMVDNDASARTCSQAASIYLDSHEENGACTNNNPPVLTDTSGCIVRRTRRAFE